jgi:ABC-type Fe3+-siderophore transport system permease subunit
MVTAKFWVSALFAVVGAALPVMTDNMDAAGWVNVAIAVCGAITVWVTPNTDAFKYVKVIASALSAGCMVAVSLISDGLSTGDKMQIAAAVLGALGVLGVKNAPQPSDA